LPSALLGEGTIAYGTNLAPAPPGLPAGSSPTGAGGALSWFLVRFEVSDPTNITLSGDLSVDGFVGETAQNASASYRLAIDDGTTSGVAVVSDYLNAGDIGADTRVFLHQLALTPGVYFLSVAAGTSDSGGSASYHFDLTVPEPSSGALLGLALGACLTASRRSAGSRGAHVARGA
jgi:hypothetical protein